MIKIKIKYGFPAPEPVAILFMLALSFSACTEPIELELESASRRLVVEGVISSDQEFQYVRLTESVPFYQDSASPGVTGADVFISDGIREEQLSEIPQFPGYYVTSGNFESVPGNTYQLSVSGVSTVGMGEAVTYTASSYMPFVGSPDSIDLVYDSNWEIWKVLLYAEDNSETEDHYMFRLYKNGTLISNHISEFSVVSDKFFDGGKAEGIWVQSIDAREGSEQLKDGDIITLQMAGITREYYRYIDAIQRENRKQYPLFSGPPANAPGNISHDALGFFAAFSVSYASYRFEDE